MAPHWTGGPVEDELDGRVDTGSKTKIRHPPVEEEVDVHDWRRPEPVGGHVIEGTEGCGRAWGCTHDDGVYGHTAGGRSARVVGARRGTLERRHR